MRLYGDNEITYNKLSKTLDPFARINKALDYKGVMAINKIFANSKRTAKHIALVYKRNATVIYPGFEFDINSEENITEQKKHFLYIGRIEKVKNIDIAIKCFKAFLEGSNDKSIKFLIAGKGSYQNNIAEFINKENMSENVKILGYISEEEKINYIKSAYSLISIADKEPFEAA